jgi:hypothetical protein
MRQFDRLYERTQLLNNTLSAINKQRLDSRFNYLYSIQYDGHARVWSIESGFYDYPNGHGGQDQWVHLAWEVTACHSYLAMGYWLLYRLAELESCVKARETA